MPAPKKLEVETEDGVVECWVHRPSGGKHPGVIMFPDAGSVRPASHSMAERLSEAGYIVLLPNIFYRSGDYAPFDFKTVFNVPDERERLMTLVRSLDLASAMRDAGHYLRVLKEQPGMMGERFGVVGYCIGGRLAFATAGSHPKQVAAAASVHGGSIATDAPDSPHLAAGQIEARLYFAVADEDRSCTPEQQAKLVTALAAAHVDFTVEHFKGCAHGFAVSDFSVYDEQACERQWEHVLDAFSDTLPEARAPFA